MKTGKGETEGMKITIPKRYQKYLNAMSEVGILKSKENLIDVFTLGMEDIIQDLKLGAGDFPPDMDKSFLKGKLIELHIPYEFSEKEKEEIAIIRKAFKVSHKTIVRAFFVQGLFEYWLDLKGSERYKKDSEFRKLIDNMPHDSFYDLPNI